MNISKQKLQNIRTGLDQIVKESGNNKDYLPLLDLTDDQINSLFNYFNRTKPKHWKDGLDFLK